MSIGTLPRTMKPTEAQYIALVRHACGESLVCHARIAGDEPVVDVKGTPAELVVAEMYATDAGLHVSRCWPLGSITVSDFPPARVESHTWCSRCGHELTLTRERVSGVCVVCAANRTAARANADAVAEINGEVRS